MLHTRLPLPTQHGQVLTGPGTGLDFMTNSLSTCSLKMEWSSARAPNTGHPTPVYSQRRDVGNLANSDSIFSLYFARPSYWVDGNWHRSNSLIPMTPGSTLQYLQQRIPFPVAGPGPANRSRCFYEKWFVHRKVRPEAHAPVDGILTIGSLSSIHAS